MMKPNKYVRGLGQIAVYGAALWLLFLFIVWIADKTHPAYFGFFAFVSVVNYVLLPVAILAGLLWLLASGINLTLFQLFTQKTSTDTPQAEEEELAQKIAREDAATFDTAPAVHLFDHRQLPERVNQKILFIVEEEQLVFRGHAKNVWNVRWPDQPERTASVVRSSEDEYSIRGSAEDNPFEHLQITWDELLAALGSQNSYDA